MFEKFFKIIIPPPSVHLPAFSSSVCFRYINLFTRPDFYFSRVKYSHSLVQVRFSKVVWGHGTRDTYPNQHSPGIHDYLGLYLTVFDYIRLSSLVYDHLRVRAIFGENLYFPEIADRHSKFRYSKSDRGSSCKVPSKI